jgi:hypothetical protein
MAELVWNDASVTISGTDLSDHVRSVTLNYGAEILEITAMGNAGVRTKIAGLKDWSLDVEFNQDYAASKVDATLFPLVGAAAFAIVVKPTSGSVSATNPSFTGNGVLETYPPVGGEVGTVGTASCSIQGTGALSRNTS